MIFIIGFTVIVIATIVTIIRSKKPIKLILAEAKYELRYHVLGSRAILEDILMKNKNKTELLPKSGKVALITGGTRGIGKEVVKKLLQCNIYVIIGCRNPQAAQILLENCREDGIDSGDIVAYQLDISVKESITNFAEIVRGNHPIINYLINNAGIMFGPYIETRDGYESQFSTNYLGHFLLTHLLLPHIKNGGESKEKARIINVTSCAHVVGDINFDDINCRNQYIASKAYAQSKLAQVLFTNYLNSLFETKNIPIQVHSVHPGIVNTELFDGTHLKTLAPWMPMLMFKTPTQGAIPIIHACVSPELEGKGGTYIHNCCTVETSQIAKSTELQEKLFKFTLDLLKIRDFEEITQIK